MEGNALALIQSWINSSKKKIIVIPRTDLLEKCDELLGVSEHSSLGTIINHTGGMSVANGRIRHFGGSNQYNLSIKNVNKLEDRLPKLIPGILLVADDILGGLFGINSGTKIGKLGSILYLPPDSYSWEDLGIGHTAFLEWSMSGDTGLFFKKYDYLKLPESVPFDKTLNFNPPLWIPDQSSTNGSFEQIDSKKSHLIRAGILNQLP
ncbi:MAG: DUF2625 family protein [Acetatifactor sp.]